MPDTAHGCPMTHREATVSAAERSCVVCGNQPCEPAHYPKHRGMGGAGAGWEPWEWCPMCRKHHRAFHDGEEWVIEALEKVAPSYFRSLT